VKCDYSNVAEQSITSYNGFHAGFKMEQGKSKSVVKDIMDKLTIIIATK